MFLLPRRKPRAIW